jgi:F-type H+-transporting ATPase subunit a
MADNQATTTVDLIESAAETAATEVTSTVSKALDGAKTGHSKPPLAGRYIEHPPEPPHFLLLWYKQEQYGLKKAYLDAHPEAAAYFKEHPEKKDKFAVETWLEKDASGNLVPKAGESPTWAQTLHAGPLTTKLPLIGYAPWENHVFFLLSAFVVIAFFSFATMGMRSNRRKALRQPGRLQVVLEWIVGSFDDFCKGVLGEENGRFYMPFIATLFTMILTMNLMGLVPLMRAATSSIVITFSLALCSFFVVQATAWVRLGPLTYLHHLAGSPKDAIGWALSPLFLILECISDFVAKPLSLSLRLMGNILGKDILLGAFLGMGISLTALAGIDFVGLPLTYPFYFLGLLLSTIQALVFSLLTMIYIMMVLPHDHDHDHDHGHEDDHGHGHTAAGHGHGGHHGAAKKVVHEAMPS